MYKTEKGAGAGSRNVEGWGIPLIANKAPLVENNIHLIETKNNFRSIKLLKLKLPKLYFVFLDRD